MRLYLAFWCNEGFESITDVSEYSSDAWKLENAQRVLQGDDPQPNPLSRTISHMCLRARFNNHRFYEIYTFTAEDTLDEYSVNKWARDFPQQAADWIRENGEKILSQRQPKEKIMID